MIITRLVVVEKVVIQGDSLNPLICNMCFNTFKIKFMGYNYTNALSPCHWFQFVDVTGIATTTQEDSHALISLPSGAIGQFLKIADILV